MTFLQELSKSDNIYYCVICIISTCYLFRSDDLSKSSLDVNEKKLKMKYLRIKESFAIAYSLSSFQYLPSLTKAMSTSLTDIDMTGGMMYIHAYSLSRNFAAMNLSLKLTPERLSLALSFISLYISYINQVNHSLVISCRSDESLYLNLYLILSQSLSLHLSSISPSLSSSYRSGESLSLSLSLHDHL